MPARCLALIVALLSGSPGYAQEAVPVLRAHSKVITIADGLHLKKNYWYVMPERPLDVYFVEIPRQTHRVTFTSDVESISFDVAYGSEHTFVVRLDNGVEARTQVRAEFKQRLAHEPQRPAGGADTIPFTLGDNDKIYVKGRLNGGPLLDLQVDLGAGGSIIKKASVPKGMMTFDGTITLHNSDGTNMVPSSSRNHLEVAGLGWEAVPFAVGDNMTHREDGLIGNSLFVDRILEIDYDRMVLVVRDAMPELHDAWRREGVILDGGVVPYVSGTLSIGEVTRAGWFLMDTGAYTSILQSNRLSAVSKFGNEMRSLLGPLGGRVAGPIIGVAGQTLFHTNYSVRAVTGDETALGVLGGDVLKRFNIVLDNRQGVVYFRPNGHFSRSVPESRVLHRAGHRRGAGCGHRVAGRAEASAIAPRCLTSRGPRSRAPSPHAAKRLAAVRPRWLTQSMTGGRMQFVSGFAVAA